MSLVHVCSVFPCPVCAGAAVPFVDTTIGSVTHAYPCDRGIPDNILGRGWHHFEASPNGVVVCRYCGRKP